MRALILLDAESGAEVSAEELVLGVFLDGGQDSLVDELLVGLALLADLQKTMAGSEDVGSLSLLLNLSVSSLEVRIGQGVGDLHSADVNLGGSGDDERLGDSSKGNVVQLKSTGNEEETRLLELLEEDNALSLMPSGKDDKHGSGGDSLSEGLDLYVSGNLGRLVENVVLLQEDGLERHKNLALSSVLRSANLLGHKLLGGGNSLLGDLGLFAKSNSSLVVHASSRESHDSGSELIITPESGRSLLCTRHLSN
ncbi:hypothetical protein PMAYCL1PPCAC_11928 [Pristionchus mayeri]|uniref:Uncharacterized protein n=1 Tax=Pristionchus mayeri TaxID=1317129 RepID=A0AAN5C8L6_9BILA|nr:hypothetical protein PMAYCL1PPCAC_11928 [Pristionchus mayeri]